MTPRRSARYRLPPLPALLYALGAAIAIAGGITVVVHGQDTRRDQRTEPSRGTGGVAGFIIDEVSGQPVRRMQVTLAATDQAVSRITYTDDSGAFLFPELPAGRYMLSATKPGYVRATYGTRRHDQRGTPVSLAAGQMLTNLRLSTNKGAVITGRVLDETGLPAFGVQVRALEYRTVLGERRLAPVTGLTGGLFGEATDDRGAYRLYGLPPGEYLIVATPRVAAGMEIRAMSDTEIREALQAAQQPARPTVGATAAGASENRRDDGITVGYAPVFYPGTTSVSSATTITLGAGQERDGVDFQIQLVRTARVEGVVVPPADIPPQSVVVMLVPDEQVATFGVLGMSALNRTTPDAEGRFSFRSVAPGRYTLSARAVAGGGARGTTPQRTMVFQSAGGAAPTIISEGGSDRPAFWATNEVAVSGDHLDNIVLSLQPAMTLSGRVEFTGSATPPADRSSVRLSMVPAPSAGMQRQVMTGVPRVQLTGGGEFTVTNVTPGRYVMSGTVPTPRESFTPATWRLASVMVEGRDILDFPLEVGPFQTFSDLVARFTDVTQGVSGSLQDATGRPAPDYTIVVFAAEPAYWLPNARRVRAARPGTDGRFAIDGLPPGSYRMAAVVEMADGDAWDPAFLEQLVPASFAFTLAAGENKVQDMRIARGGL